MSSGLELRSIGSLLSKHFSGAWGSDPGRGSSNATVLRSTDIDDEGHVDLTSGAQRQLSPRDLSAKRLRAGDILLEASGGGPGKPVGRPAWFADETPVGQYATSNFFKVLRANPNLVDAKFLLYALVLLVKRPEIWRFQQQTTGITNLKFSEYLRHVIVTPPLPEQRRIANVLDALDAQIRIGSEMVSKLDRLSAGLANRLLHDGADGGKLPAGWKSSTVGEVYEVQAGITLGPHRAPGRNSTGYLRVANVQRSVINLGDIARLHASPVEQAKYRLTAGDLLVVEGHADVNQIGRCARVPEGAEGLVYQNHLFRLRSTQLDQVVGEAWMNSRFARQYWRRTCSSSSGLNTINSKQLKAMRVLVPPPEEQARMSATLLGMAERIQRERDALDKLALQKAGLMTDLLTGRVRVPTEVAHE
jgi:type I restriction enzyme, S subunit